MKNIMLKCCGWSKSKLPPNFSWVLEDTLAGCGTPEKREELQARAVNQPSRNFTVPGNGP